MTNHTYMHLKLHTINYFRTTLWRSSLVTKSGTAVYVQVEKLTPFKRKRSSFPLMGSRQQIYTHKRRYTYVTFLVENELPFFPQPTYRLLESIKLGHAPVIRHYLHLVASCNSHPFQVRNVRVVDLNYFAALGGFEKYPVRLDFQTPKVLEYNNTQIISTRF